MKTIVHELAEKTEIATQEQIDRRQTFESNGNKFHDGYASGIKWTLGLFALPFDMLKEIASAMPAAAPLRSSAPSAVDPVAATLETCAEEITPARVALEVVSQLIRTTREGTPIMIADFAWKCADAFAAEQAKRDCR